MDWQLAVVALAVLCVGVPMLVTKLDPNFKRQMTQPSIFDPFTEDEA